MREKIALLVFAIVVVCGLGGLVWYLFVGHSWNVTASAIDDTFGSMDGYTVVVFPGTVDPAKAEGEKLGTGTGTKKEGSSVNRAPSSAGSKDSPASSGSSASKNSSAPKGSPSSGGSSSAPKGSPSSGGSSSAPKGSASSADIGVPLPLDPALPNSGTPSGLPPSASKIDPVTVEEVQADYEEKGAQVIVLDTDNLATYADGTILKKCGHRYGVFSVNRLQPYRAVADQVAYFQAHEVDFIVALTPSTSYVAAVEGIDIVITTSNEQLSAMGQTSNGAFYVNAPLQGEVGAILVSPSNVVSAKVISSL